MKLQALLSQPTAPRNLNLILLGIWSLIGVLGAGWTFLAVRNRSFENEARVSCRDLEGRITEAEASIARAKKSPDTTVPKGLSIISAFQSNARGIIEKWGCTMDEFNASQQISDYITRFAKDTRPNDWKQIDVVAKIRGPAPFLVSALKDIAACGIPFEFNSIDLKRFSTTESGTGTVSCQLALRLITRNPGGGT